MIANVFITAIVGGFLCLDRVFLLLMISRPIIAAPVIGFILGDPYTGLVAGAFTELFWIDRLPIGMYIPPNDTITAILIAASSIEAARILGSMPHGLLALTVLAYVPFGHVAQKMDLWIVKGNEKLAGDVRKDVLNGDVKSLSRKHLFALLKTWAFSAGFILLALLVGIPLLAFLYPSLPGWTIRGLGLLYPLLPLIGTAVAINSVHVRGVFPIFCGVFLFAGIVFYYLKGII
ncbi:MAG: PTS sugar transporter subunit IIC [Syntrophales bacterium]|jgi:PTS system mannose-specific IIC component|nr:PTS sugar transporter subunit IIC [Syntrophales bacterium]